VREGKWEGDGDRGGDGASPHVRTSFSIFTLALIPSTAASFWLSRPDRTASLYWPLHGRASRQPAALRILLAPHRTGLLVLSPRVDHCLPHVLPAPGPQCHPLRATHLEFGVAGRNPPPFIPLPLPLQLSLPLTRAPSP